MTAPSDDARDDSHRRAAATQAIANLIFGLAEAIDDADHDRIERLFGDATFRLGDRPPRQGGAAFRQVIERSMLLHDGRPKTHHVVTNLQVELAEDGRSATTRSYVTVLQAVSGFPLQPVLAGRYHDRFELDDAGTWRWVERRMTIELVGDTSRHTPTQL
jgi:hypothetical protein